MGLLERVRSQALAPNPPRGRSQDDGSLSLDDWASIFTFGGIAYPLLQTTMGSVDRERILATAIGAHQGNGAIFALTAARVQAFAQARFGWTRFTTGTPNDLFGSPELGVLENPWPGGHTPQLLAKMEIDNCIAGNAYIVRSRRDRLARLRPDLVMIVLGSQTDADYPADAEDVEIAGYAYYPRSGRPTFLLPNEVAHYAPLPDPTFQFLGMSWMTPVIREIQADTLAVEHKARFFENSATPNLAIKFDPQLPIEMVRQFKELFEEEHRGAWNAFKTLYLGGGADVTPVGTDFKQMDYANTQGKGESRLAAAAGVPPSWVGFSEGLQGSAMNAGNFNTARRRFSDGTMHHLWMSAAAALENVLDKPDPYTNLWFDTRHAPFMRADKTDIATIQTQEAQTISALVQQGFTPESVVKAVVNDDMGLLKHTGLTSVQLHKPGETAALPGNGNGKTAAPAASVNGKTPGGSA